MSELFDIILLRVNLTLYKHRIERKYCAALHKQKYERYSNQTLNHLITDGTQITVQMKTLTIRELVEVEDNLVETGDQLSEFSIAWIFLSKPSTSLCVLLLSNELLVRQTCSSPENCERREKLVTSGSVFVEEDKKIAQRDEYLKIIGN